MDGRNPLFYLSKDLRTYAESELNKPMLIVINKCNFLTTKQRRQWHTYLTQNNIQHVFFSAYTEKQKIDNAAQQERKKLQQQYHNDPRLHNDGDDPKEQEEEDDDAITE